MLSNPSGPPLRPHPHLNSVIPASIGGRKQRNSGRLVSVCIVVTVVHIHLAVKRGDTILLHIMIIHADLHSVGIALDPGSALHFPLVSLSLALSVFPVVDSHQGHPVMNTVMNTITIAIVYL